MDEDAVLDMPFHRTRQHDAFNGPPDPLQLADIMPMADPLHILLNDRSAVQLFRHIVGRCTDDFNTALVCLRIRIAANKSREEGMVDIDDPVPIMRDE
ncbi:hypothetical protein D3C72_2166730 [compost metagenome]